MPGYDALSGTMKGYDHFVRQTTTLLREAMHAGSMNIVKLLLDHGADMYVDCGRRFGLVHLAIAEEVVALSKVQCLEEMIRHGFDVNTLRSNVVGRSNEATVLVLLNAGIQRSSLCENTTQLAKTGRNVCCDETSDEKVPKCLMFQCRIATRKALAEHSSENLWYLVKKCCGLFPSIILHFLLYKDN